jgi:CsoR family transcriptional regulator, copper-sensing transcriptional repressor
MVDAARQKTVRRLQSIEGHVRAIQRMVEQDEYCIDVIRQINAVQAALNKVSQVVLEEHLSHCVTEAVRGDDSARREQVLQEIADLFEHAGGRGS